MFLVTADLVIDSSPLSCSHTQNCEQGAQKIPSHTDRRLKDLQSVQGSDVSQPAVCSQHQDAHNGKVVLDRGDEKDHVHFHNQNSQTLVRKCLQDCLSNRSNTAKLSNNTR